MAQRLWWVAAVAALACGCGRDADQLARVGRKVAGRAEALAEGAQGRIGPRLQSVRESLGDGATTEGRVAARLRWDKALAGAEIQVQISEGAVELKGTAADENQKQRAEELARTTAGVESVRNEIAVKVP